MIEFLTFILVVITGIYAYLTYQILEANRCSVAAMQTQIKAATRPYVHFDLIPDGSLIEACLRNTGVAAALDVTVVVSPPLHTVIRGESKPSRITGTLIASVAPGREFREFIGSWEEVRSITENLAFTVAVSYRDSAGNKYVEEFSVDLAGFGDMPYINRPKGAEEMKKIAKNLESIQKSIDSLRLRQRG